MGPSTGCLIRWLSKKADELNQETTHRDQEFKKDSKMSLSFCYKMRKNILEKNIFLQSLTYQTVSDFKKAESNFYVGYILPFNIVGPPVTG